MKYLANPSDACQVFIDDKEYEIRITDDREEIEIWEVGQQGFITFIDSFKTQERGAE